MAFWKSVKKLDQNRLPTLNSVDNMSAEVAIAEVWRYHYESILNYVDQSKNKHNVATPLCNTNFACVCS